MMIWEFDDSRLRWLGSQDLVGSQHSDCSYPREEWERKKENVSVLDTPSRRASYKDTEKSKGKKESEDETCFPLII